MSDQNDENEPTKSGDASEREAQGNTALDQSSESEESSLSVEDDTQPDEDDGEHSDKGDDEHDDEHGDEHDDEHDGNELGHIASVKVLLGTFGALMVLTVLTVLATKVDFGGQLNLVIAMLIATFKAGLVCMFFMHLRYDKAMHTVIFLTALLFALLYISFTLMDKSHYQDDIDWKTYETTSQAH